MGQVRFFTDEDVYGAIAIALRNSGFDAVSTPKSGRLGETDESQLQGATDKGRVLVTFNVAHFTNLHSQWMSQDRHRTGIVVSFQQPIGVCFAWGKSWMADTMQDRPEFLSDW